MATKTELCAHRRVEYPQPSGETWKIGCACGWKGGAPQWTENLKEELNRQFVEHVPEDQRRVYVRVDRRPGCEGQWLMPEGVFCTFGKFWGDIENGFFVAADHPVQGIFPVGEVFTADGQIFRFEDDD